MQSSKLEDSRILIVDDLPDNIRLLERVLAYAGFRNCLSTTAPREVLMLAAQFQPDLIILDLNMPRLDGFDILQQLRATALHAGLPVMILTADVSPESRRKALRLGAKDFLGKPFPVPELILRIRKLLEAQQRLNQEVPEQGSSQPAGA